MQDGPRVTGDSAGRHGRLGLEELITGALRVRGWIEEAQQTLFLIVAQDTGPDDRDS